MSTKDKKSWVNFLMDESEENHKDKLAQLLKDPDNRQLFQNYIKTNYIIDSSINS